MTDVVEIHPAESAQTDGISPADLAAANQLATEVFRGFAPSPETLH